MREDWIMAQSDASRKAMFAKRNKKTATLGVAFGKLEQVDPNDIPITPPPNAPKCKKCGGSLALFGNRTECRKCKDVVKS